MEHDEDAKLYENGVKQNVVDDDTKTMIEDVVEDVDEMELLSVLDNS